ncbi:NADPH dehydrogenase NamA [Paenibacillus sp. 481]|uniref:NADPH dehydrogenase NamA n=1 Tax=Paenibacillus sp. 481 TaxID=2835869 RepID=UPI001E4B8711|nr:NADPH dehydrogenase NamA [Paenibacillus sp. 481]UHA73695.1 NADPH dehydrogenase NamA [Paenibacillus sp. 481]
MSLLFTPITINGLALKNRIMMSPMVTSMATPDGIATEWHTLHYGARALGQVGLIMVESTVVVDPGPNNYAGVLGLWRDDHIPQLRELVRVQHLYGSKVGIQLVHIGLKTETERESVAPSAVPFQSRMPKVLNEEEIQDLVQAFKHAARRAVEAGFDVIEIHAAHGYLVNNFLSPYTNHREDKYGGTRDKRYQFLREVIDEIRSFWSGPLFVRVSAVEYGEGGNTVEDHIYFAKLMKEQGVDLIDVSSGGVLPIVPQSFPGYQVPYADAIRREAGIATAAVGLIKNGLQAEEIVQNGRADLVAIGRELLNDPFWARTAARQLGETIEAPGPYGHHWFSTP